MNEEQMIDFYLGATSLDVRVYGVVDRSGGVRITKMHPTCDERLEINVAAFCRDHRVVAEAMAERLREAAGEADALWKDAS